jgi:predicted HTH domain antitoxin
LWLFQRERVTLTKAAEIAGVSLYEFLNLCKSNQIPVIDMSRDELTAELEGFGKT